MYCSNCGKEIDNNAKFCQYCGSQIGQNNQQVEQQPTQNHNAMTTHYQQNLEKLKKKIQLNGLFLFNISNLTLNIANDGSNIVHIMGDITLKNGGDLKAPTEAVLTITKGLFNTTEKTYSLDNSCTFDFKISYDELLKAVSLLITARPAKVVKPIETTLSQDSNTSNPQPNGCLTAIRYFFAVMFFLCSIVYLCTPEMRCAFPIAFLLGCWIHPKACKDINNLADKAIIFLNSFTPNEIKQTTFYQNNATRKGFNTILMVIAIIVTVVLAPQESFESSNNSTSSGTTSKSTYKAPIEAGAISELPTVKGKGYDKTIDRYGVEGIKRINLLVPKVADKVACNTACDAIVNADVSDNKTTSLDNLVFYVDCKNGKRFYVNESELPKVNVPKATKTTEAPKLVKGRVTTFFTHMTTNSGDTIELNAFDPIEVMKDSSKTKWDVYKNGSKIGTIDKTYVTFEGTAAYEKARKDRAKYDQEEQAKIKKVENNLTNYVYKFQLAKYPESSVFYIKSNVWKNLAYDKKQLLYTLCAGYASYKTGDNTQVKITKLKDANTGKIIAEMGLMGDVQIK